MNISVNLDSGYEFSENTKIYFNGVDVTSSGYTEIKKTAWEGRVTIDLGTAGTALEVYTITYDANGGSGTMASHTATQGVPEKLRPCTFTPPEGKVFASWEINGVSGYKDTNSYTFTSDTTVKAIWKDDNYIRISNATMIPSTITSDICANDLIFTSSEPDKYSVAFWRVYDFTDDGLNTTVLNEYPHDKKFIARHVYSIEMEFTAVTPYEYDVSHSEYGSKFYIDGVETMMSKAVDLTYSTLRRIEKTAVSSDMQVTHTVTFNLDGGTMQATNPVVVNDGETVTEPTPVPTKDGCTFGGWYADSTFNTPFDFSTHITTDGLIIYAKWNEAEPMFDIIYDFNGGSRSGEGSYVEHSVAYGMILSKANLIDNMGVIAPGEKELEAAMINGTRYELDSTYILNTNSNIQYLWKNKIQESFSVIFELNYNSPNSLMTLNNLASGSKVNAPNPAPARDGYTFEGWYEDQTCTTPFDFETDTIKTNTTIYAKWVENKTQKITLQLDNAVVSGNVITFNVDGTDVTATVSGTGYTFNNILVEGAGEIDQNKTNVIKVTPRFGDKNISECTINGVVYTANSENVEIYDFGWFITVQGATKYAISATGDASLPTPKTIIWVNPDYVPENGEDAQWVSDFTISHGSARVIEVYDENDNLVDPDTYTSIDADEYGLDDGFGWVAIMPGSRVVFEFIPEYGYQLTGIAINEMPLEAVEDMNRFEVYIPKDSGNLHFAATFTKTEDIVKTDSEKVKSGEIFLGNKLKGGTAKLTVNDVKLSSDKIKGFEEAAGEYTISNYLDIDLYNVFYKGKNDSEDVWSNKIDELEKEATITLKLADGITADDIVIVHNVHDGDKYEIIKIDSYDKKTNTITFKTKSFSNYAIASKTGSSTTEGATGSNNDKNTGKQGINITDGDDNQSGAIAGNTIESGTVTVDTQTSDNNMITDTTTNSSPKTGDNVVLWIGIMLVSVFGVCGTYMFLRKGD